jgi:hypothetical protein
LPHHDLTFFFKIDFKLAVASYLFFQEIGIHADLCSPVQILKETIIAINGKQSLYAGEHRLQKRLKKAELIIDIHKHLSHMLAIPLEASEIEEDD